ncbi:MAG: hypothetical protein AAGB48_08475 [Planctomycetota bacterium]
MTTTTTITQTQPQNANTVPIDRFVYGSLHVTIWENTDRDDRAYFSIRVERRYKDNKGAWQSSNRFGKNAIPVLSDLLGKAYARLSELEADRRSS